MLCYIIRVSLARSAGCGRAPSVTASATGTYFYIILFCIISSESLSHVVRVAVELRVRQQVRPEHGMASHCIIITSYLHYANRVSLAPGCDLRRLCHAVLYYTTLHGITVHCCIIQRSTVSRCIAVLYNAPRYYGALYHTTSHRNMRLCHINKIMQYPKCTT